MKFIRTLLVALVCCFAAGSAFANNIHVVFDPIPIPPGTFGIVTDPTAIYSTNWESCNSQGIPQSEFGSDDACIALVNETGVSLTQLNLSFTVTPDLVGGSITCTPLDGVLPVNNCGTATPPGGFTLGQTVSVEFTVGAGMAVPNLSAFFFGEQGAPDLLGTTVDITAPEPGSLTLLAAGMGLIGLCMVFGKR